MLTLRSPLETLEGEFSSAPVVLLITEDAAANAIHADDSTVVTIKVGASAGAAPLEGAPAGTTVMVREVPAVAYREVVLRDGKPVAVRIIAVTDKTVATVLENSLDGSANVYAATKR